MERNMTIDPKFYIVEKDGPVVIWRFNNPPQNLMNLETMAELTELVEEFEADPELRAAILTSNLPNVFIQHFDVATILTFSDMTPEEIAANRELQKATAPEPRGLGRLRRKPIIAAINGQTAGGGCETTLMCEFRFMSRNASLGCPEVNVGILPGGGGTQRMTRLLGLSKAMEMLLLGRVVDADEAERIQLVHKAFDHEELMPAAVAFARELAMRPPMAIGHIMECIYEGSQKPLAEGLALESRLFFELTQSEDARNAMSAYVATGQNVTCRSVTRTDRIRRHDQTLAALPTPA
jgi:enoyl-CoA hydratase